MAVELPQFTRYGLGVVMVTKGEVPYEMFTFDNELQPVTLF